MPLESPVTFAALDKCKGGREREEGIIEKRTTKNKAGRELKDRTEDTLEKCIVTIKDQEKRKPKKGKRKKKNQPR